MRWQIVVFDGSDELDFVAPFEVLRMAAAHKRDWIVELALLDAPREFIANHGLCLRPTAKLGPLKGSGRPDVVIVPGGGWIDRNPYGARAEVERGVLPAALGELHQAGSVVAAVCSGAMILAAAGLLKNRPATTHHLAIDELRSMGVQIVSARVVDDGDIVTAGGVTSGLDLALHLVERFAGNELAREIEKGLEYERHGKVYLGGKK